MSGSRKRLLGTLFAAVLALGLIPTTAFATVPVSYTGEETGVSLLAVTEVNDADGTLFDKLTGKFRIYNDYWANIVKNQPSGYEADNQNKTVSISTAEGLVWWAKQVNIGVNFSNYTVSIMDDIDLAGYYWTPIDTATIEYEEDDGKVSWTTVDPKLKLDNVTIDGNGHTITGLATATGLRGPAQPSEPGDGQDCYYYSAFIGRNDGTLTIQNITFDKASIAMTEPAAGVSTNGSSMCAVVTAINSGALTMTDVTVSNSKVLAMQKASALLGMPSSGSFTVNQCTVTGCDIQAYFQVAPICGYVGTAGYPISVNGIKLENNTTALIHQAAPWQYKAYNGAVYYGHPGYYGSDYYIGAAETAVLDKTGTVSVDGATCIGKALALVAEVNGYQYDTLAAAIAAVPDGVETTVKLTADCRLDDTVTIPAGRIVVLDLNGMTVTESGAETRKICNKGQLTILSSADGGTLKNKDEGSYGLIDNYGTLKIQGGNYENYGRASGAAIKNRPGATLLEISGGVFAGLVEDPGGDQNGYATAANVLVASDAPLVVTGGTFSSRAHYSAVFKVFSDNADIRNATVSTYMAGGIEVAGGNAVLTDCEFHVSAENSYYANAVAVSSGGVATIDGGTYAGYKYAAYVYNSGGTIDIRGGKYDAETVLKADKSTTDVPSAITVSSGAFTGNFGIDSDATLSIAGGYFSTDPSDYVAADQGLAAVEGSYVQDGVTYSYQVTTALVENVEVKPGDTEATVPSAEKLGITGDQKQALDTAVSGITGTGLSSAGNAVASDTNKLPTADEALKDFNSNLPEGAAQASSPSEVIVVVVPRLDVTVEAYDPEENKLELDIKAVYDLKATTNPSNMKEENDAGVASNAVNTVTLKKNAGTLNTTGTQVKITVPLPAGFVKSADESIFVTHAKDGGSKYVYKATVESDDSGVFTASFLNPNGFSSFTLTTDTAASITDDGTTTYYETLQEAVDAVDNGQTILLEKDSVESVVVSKVVSFTLDKNSQKFTGSIAAGSGYTMTVSGDTYTFAASAPAPTPTPVEEYSVTVAEAENGKVVVDPTAASAGERVTVTTTPAEGYEVASVAVTSGGKQVDVTDSGDGTFTFVMPAGDVTVTVTFEASAPAVELPFTDVAEGDWYYGAVSFVYAKGLMTGYEGTTLFGPEDDLGREQAAAVLYRALGAGAEAPACGLADVSQADWYAQAVNWAVASGLVTGYDDGSGLFGVGDALTRDQFAAIVARVAKADLSKADPSALEGFSDGGEVAGWAVPAVSWAVEAGVLKGSDDGNGGMELRASAEITRGEMAAMIMRAAEAGLLPAA